MTPYNIFLPDVIDFVEISPTVNDLPYVLTWIFFGNPFYQFLSKQRRKGAVSCRDISMVALLPINFIDVSQEVSCRASLTLVHSSVLLHRAYLHTATVLSNAWRTEWAPFATCIKNTWNHLSIALMCSLFRLCVCLGIQTRVATRVLPR